MFAERDGVKLYYGDYWHGAPVLLHSGAYGDGLLWQPAGYPVSLTGKRLINIDPRGHGRSSMPRGVAAYRPQQYADDVIAVLDAAGIERTAIVGYGMGGNVALTAAASYPDRFYAVVSLGFAPIPHDPDPARLRADVDDLRLLGPRPLVKDLALSESETQDEPPWLVENMSSTDRETLALTAEAWAGHDVLPLLGSITCPTFFLVGENDTSPGAAERALALVPAGGRAFELPRHGHFQTLWNREATGERIDNFIEDALAGALPA
jgi:pimeloyl-ACP methyl ester carboxylesterase